MTVNEIRAKYLAFFEAHGHVVIPSASLIPQSDPTTLFTGSGMQPLITNLLGAPHPLGLRLTDSQKCFRADDIAEVGDNRHITFFEMLGNWSLGDYFKKEQLPWIFSFLTDEIKLDPEKLFVTVFIGDENNKIPRDTESAEIWKELFSKKGITAKDVLIGSEADGYRLGMQGGRVFYYDAKKNWWSRAGVPEQMPAGEPGGPDSEIFYDFGTPHDIKYGPECHPNCDCGRFLEIANSVFMQYLKQPDGSFTKLPKQNVDFGGGLERIAMVSLGKPDMFEIDTLRDPIELLELHSQKAYDDSRYQRSFRIAADHIRGAVFMIAEGIRPSNTERGYILRRLIRRAAQHAAKLDIGGERPEDSMLVRSAILVTEKYKQAYPELDSEEAFETIRDEIWKEEKQFAHTLERGMKEFEKIAATGHIEPNEAFMLFTTYGFPFEMTLEIARERGIDVDEDGFKSEMKRHQELSRAGSEQKFKGGLADHSEKTTRLHTAHHLLLAALQEILGTNVKQRGSNITQERLRLDFSFDKKMTPEQIAAVEKIVNQKIKESLPVERVTMPKGEAETLGAQHEFGAKYPDTVSVYFIGPRENAFSIEFCGGPHVSNTSELIGTFKILKEEAVASGIRRIKAVLA